MFCDHFGQLFLNGFIPFRCIGRFAFPIYAFLIAEGYRHIRQDPERVNRHLGAYIVLALVSEFCYDLMEYDTLDALKLIGSQNALITLLLSFLGLMAIDKWKEEPLYLWSSVALTALMSYIAQSNYKLAGVLLVYAFYIYLERAGDKDWFVRLMYLEMIFLIYLPVYHWARYDFCSFSGFMDNLSYANRCWYLSHLLIPFVLASYNGQLGHQSKAHRKVYKVFYPAHMLLLGILKHIV